MNFLTVEDINSTLLNYGNINEFFEFDSSRVSIIEEEWVTYDFIRIFKSENKYYFDINNSLWTGGYYVTDKDDNFIDTVKLNFTPTGFYELIVEDYVVINDQIVRELPEGFKLYLYMSNYHESFQESHLYVKVTNLKNFNVRYNDYFDYRFYFSNINDFDLNRCNVSIQIGSHTYTGIIDKNNDSIHIKTSVPLTESCHCKITIVDGVLNENTYYFFVNVLKDNLIFDLSADLLVGKVNTVNIITDNSIDLTGVTGSVNIDGEISDLNFIDNQFTVDLTEETMSKQVSVIVTVNEDNKFYGYSMEFLFNSHYFQPITFAELKNELEKVNGAPIVELTANLVGTNDINVNHDVLIRNNNEYVRINLHNYSFIINENIDFKIDNVTICRGNPAFTQKPNSKLEINNCTFEICSNVQMNNLGSVVCCDIDIKSLNGEDNFFTVINNSEFKRNHSIIFHGGQLTVNNCKFHQVDNLLWDYNNPSFLYQVNGDATITNSIFDFDSLDDNTHCINQKNFGFSQAIIMCGVSATINNANHEDLQANNTLPFFESPFNNKSHLFLKYYYPEIESCVFSSPLPNFEDKCCCHAVSGVDWIFKENIQITRADWGTQNDKRLIEW